MNVEELQTKRKIQKDVLEIYRELKKLSLEYFFNDIVTDAQNLGLLILKKEYENHSGRSLKNWADYMRNISMEISTKGPIPLELIDVLDYKPPLLPYDYAYFSSFYFAHIHCQGKSNEDLKKMKGLSLRLILKLLGGVVLGIAPSLPIEIKKLTQEFIDFSYEEEIVMNKKLLEEGKLPSPEEVLENFKAKVFRK